MLNKMHQRHSLCVTVMDLVLTFYLFTFELKKNQGVLPDCIYSYAVTLIQMCDRLLLQIWLAMLLLSCHKICNYLENSDSWSCLTAFLCVWAVTDRKCGRVSFFLHRKVNKLHSCAVWQIIVLCSRAFLW